MQRLPDRQRSRPRRGRAAAIAAALAVAVALAAARPLNADLGRWTVIGPYVADVTSLAIDPKHPSVLYAATNGGAGVWKSADGGANWTPIHEGIPRDQGQATAIAVNPLHPAILLLAIGSGIWKSVNGGAAWTPSSQGLEDLYVRWLVIDPQDPLTTYAGAGGGVYKSIDGGAHWAPAQNGLPQGVPEQFIVAALAIDPSAPGTLYAALESGGVGVYKSIDGGASWLPAGSPPPLSGLRAIAVDPRSPRTVVAGGGTGIWKTVDGGATWTRINQGLPDRVSVNALSIDPGPARALYAGTYSTGVWRSRDGGATWEAASQGLSDPDVQALAVDPAGSGALYAGTSSLTALGGVFKTGDGGASWSAAVHGPSAVFLYDLEVGPVSGDTLWLGTEQLGLLVSRNGGGSWSAVGGLPKLFEIRVVLDPLAPATLYAGGIVAFGALTTFFRSSDGGATWAPLQTPQCIGSLAVDPQDDDILYGAGCFGILRSADGGASWTAAAAGDLAGADVNVVIDPLTPATVYAFGVLPQYRQPGLPRLYKSLDRGITWMQIAPALGSISRLRVDPRLSGTLYALIAGQIWKTADGGASWSAAYSPPDPTGLGVSEIAIAPTTPSTVYAVLGYERPVRSADGGITWSAVSSAGLGDTVGELVVDPQDPGHLFIASDLVASMTEPPACAPGPAALCLNGSRFQVGAAWRTAQASGAAQAMGLTLDTGAFWFFDAADLELLVKVLNGCGVNGHYWVFAAGLTDVAVTLTVTDSATGQVRTYTNPQGVPFAPQLDTEAFAACP